MEVMKKFNVIIEDFNNHKFIPYDVIPHLVRRHKEVREKPVTFDQFKEYVEKESFYQWHSRCEYEITAKSLFGTLEKKIDAYWQVLLNLDIITQIIMDEVENKNNK